MKFKYILLSSMLAMIQPTFAYKHHEPAACPSLDAIKNVGFDMVVPTEDTSKYFAIITKNNFDTEDEWTFGMLPVTGSDENEARENARNDLDSMTLVDGPSENEGKFACAYMTSMSSSQEVILGVAITPPLEFPSLLSHLYAIKR